MKNVYENYEDAIEDSNKCESCGGTLDAIITKVSYDQDGVGTVEGFVNEGQIDPSTELCFVCVRDSESDTQTTE